MRTEIEALEVGEKKLFLLNGTPIEVTMVDNENNYDVTVYCCTVDNNENNCSAKIYEGVDGEPLNMQNVCQQTMTFTSWESDIQDVLGETNIHMRESEFIVATPVFGDTIDMIEF